MHLLGTSLLAALGSMSVLAGTTRATGMGSEEPSGAAALASATERADTPGDSDAEALKRFRLERHAVETPDDPDLFATTSSGAISAGVFARVQRVLHAPLLFEITLQNTGSGFQEPFLLQLPSSPLPAGLPLLVVFHKAGVSHWDAWYNTSFFNEARSRNWVIVTPLGFNQSNFGSIPSQQNIQAVLSYMANSFNIDKQRVYGVGFSMGGGSVTNYGARHLDPGDVMFAAITNHTGGVSLPHTYANEGPQIRTILENLYGGPPSLQAFNYLQCSTIDLATNGSIDSTTDLSRNLQHIPVLDWMASNDPLLYLRQQTLAFDGHVHAQNPSNTFQVVPDGVHAWTTLDEVQVCDWMSQFSLALPESGRTLVDEDGVYFHFQVHQGVAGAFTPFTWTVEPAVNRLRILNSTNLSRLSFATAAAGLNVVSPLSVDLSTSDGTGDQLLLLNVPNPPSAVQRDAQLASGVYDAVNQTLLINETQGGLHHWVIYFP